MTIYGHKQTKVYCGTYIDTYVYIIIYVTHKYNVYQLYATDGVTKY